MCFVWWLGAVFGTAQPRRETGTAKALLSSLLSELPLPHLHPSSILSRVVLCCLDVLLVLDVL